MGSGAEKLRKKSQTHDMALVDLPPQAGKHDAVLQARVESRRLTSKIGSTLICGGRMSQLRDCTG